MKTLAVVLTLLGFGVVDVGASERTLHVPRNLIDVQDTECSSLDTVAPEHHELPVVGDYTTILDFDVHVLVVGVSQEIATRVMKYAKDVYAPLNIRLRVIYEAVDLKIDVPPDTSATGQVISASESQAYINASKEYFGGVRPPHADAVYTMLGGELASAVAGQADCVGGIAYPDAAFAVGEVRWDNARREKVSGKIAAHELAHLLGAHHHYANCAQGNPNDIISDFTPCTLMFNDVGLVSLHFSTLEGAVTRRWALDYLGDQRAPAPSPSPSSSPSSSPQPEPSPTRTPIAGERTVNVSLEDAAVVGEVVVADDAYWCGSDVPVVLQRSNNGKWRKVRRLATDEESSFRFEITEPGRYRVRAPQVEFDDGDTCGVAVSRVLRVS